MAIKVSVERVDQFDDDEVRNAARHGYDISGLGRAPHIGVKMPASSQRFVIEAHDLSTGESLELVVDYHGRCEVWAEGMARFDGALLRRAVKKLRRVLAEVKREREVW